MRPDLSSIEDEQTSAASAAQNRASETAAIARLSMNQTTTYRWSFFEDVMAYRDAGLGAIGVWRPKLVEWGEERGIDLIRQSDLAVSSVSWAGGFTGPNGHSFAESMHDARDAVRIAGELCADCLAIVSGGRCGHTANHARRLLIDALEALGDCAAEYGVLLALQPMHELFSTEWTFLTSIDQTLDVIAECDHDFVRMAFDAYHLWQEPDLENRIRQIAPLVSAVQLSDWRDPPRSEHDRSLPGDGRIPLAEIVRAFDAAGYRGRFEISVWSEEVWSSDYRPLLHACRDRFVRLWRS